MTTPRFRLVILRTVERVSEAIGGALIGLARVIDEMAYAVADVAALGLVVVLPFVAIAMLISVLVS